MNNFKTIQIRLSPVEYLGLKEIMHTHGYKKWKRWLLNME